MTHIIRLPTFATAMAAVFCLATLAPTASNEAVAQTIRVYGSTHYYNGYGAGYNNGYGNGYSRYGYDPYGHGGRGYTGYGYGVYGYGLPSPYVYRQPTTSFYGYRSGTSVRLNYRSLHFGGGTYIPNNARYYSPYGYRGF